MGKSGQGGWNNSISIALGGVEGIEEVGISPKEIKEMDRIPARCGN